jgi:hypothetical protein
MQTTDETGTGQGTTVGGDGDDTGFTPGERNTIVRYQLMKARQMRVQADMAELWGTMTRPQRAFIMDRTPMDGL